MAATAGDSATSPAGGDSATSPTGDAATSPAGGVPATSPAGIGPAPAPAIPAHCMHKNRLQEFAQRAHKKLPVYNIEYEGEHHLPKFKCTVEIDGELFSSTRSFTRRKEAEQDAARVAYETLVTRDMADVKDVFELIDQGAMFCKSILHEFAVKMVTAWPSYSVVQEKPRPLFVASVMFGGNTYTGEVATNKKDAEQKAAYAAIKSILATGNTCIIGIIRSKEKLITAIRSSRNSNYTGAIRQEVHNTPTKTLATFIPIKFTRPAAYTSEQDRLTSESQDQPSLLMTVQEHNIVPAVDPSMNPSAEVVTRSRKRKSTDEGSNITEEKVAKEH